MNFMFQEARQRLQFAGQSNLLQFGMVGHYWRLPGSKDLTEIWIVKTGTSPNHDMVRQQGFNYATFSSEQEVEAYCVLKDIKPSKASWSYK